MSTSLYTRKLNEYKRLLSNASVSMRLTTLPTPMQFALHAYFEEQLPIEAIARQMNKSVSTIRNYYTHGLFLLQEYAASIAKEKQAAFPQSRAGIPSSV